MADLCQPLQIAGCSAAWDLTCIGHVLKKCPHPTVLIAVPSCRLHSVMSPALRLESLQGLVGPPEKPKEAAKEATAHHAAPAQDLPVSIQANREPYFQGDWRQKPYTAR